MAMGHEEILTERLLDGLDDDAAALARLPIPDDVRALIAERLNARRAVAWEIDAAQRSGQYLTRTGKLPRRMERETRGGAKHAA